MVRVKLLVPRFGDGFNQKAGDVIEVADDEAERMLADQQCVLTEAPSHGGEEDAGTPAASGKPSKATGGRSRKK